MRWTPYKILTLALTIACLTLAVGAKLNTSREPDGERGAMLVFGTGALVFGSLFGLLNVKKTFEE